MTRDVAPRIGCHKPAVIHAKFFPALKGEDFAYTHAPLSHSHKFFPPLEGEDIAYTLRTLSQVPPSACGWGFCIHACTFAHSYKFSPALEDDDFAYTHALSHTLTSRCRLTYACPLIANTSMGKLSPYFHDQNILVYLFLSHFSLCVPSFLSHSRSVFLVFPPSSPSRFSCFLNNNNK